jgi:monofunctional biosynthetic peptidoglycan transglycosylase
MEHSGFDWVGIENALKKNQRKGKKVAGGSTITQQLAKNLFLSPSRSYFRKIEEAIKAVEEAVKTEDADKIMESISALATPAFPLFEAMQAANSPETENAAEPNTEAKSDDNVVDAEFTEVKKDAE